MRHYRLFSRDGRAHICDVLAFLSAGDLPAIALAGTCASSCPRELWCGCDQLAALPPSLDERHPLLAVIAALGGQWLPEHDERLAAMLDGLEPRGTGEPPPPMAGPDQKGRL